MAFLVAMFIVLEIAVLCIAGFVLFRAARYPFAESVSFGIMLALLALSLELQVVFLLGVPALSLLFEGVLLGGALVVLLTRRHVLMTAWQRLQAFGTVHPLVSLLLVVCWSYLAALALLLPPLSVDTLAYQWSRVLLFQQEHTLLLKHANWEPQATYPVGHDILGHLFLRFQTDYGLALFSLLGYVGVGSGSYALARRYARPDNALCAMLVVVSMPLLVYLATSGKSDLFGLAVALCSVLAAHRLLEEPTPRDLLLLVASVLFVVAIKITLLAFVGLFGLIFGVLLLQRYGILLWLRLLAAHWRVAVLLLPPAIVLSQGWLFAHNHVVWGGWSGSQEFLQFHRNPDGLPGMLANLVRYAFGSADLVWDIAYLAEYMTGHNLQDVYQRVYDTLLYPWLGNSGLHYYDFEIRWRNNEYDAAFGPLGLLVIVPAWIYALVRGSTVLRGVALLQVSYAAVVAWQLSWIPMNRRLLALGYVLGVVCVAYMLERLRWQRVLRPLIMGAAALLLVYTCLFKENMALFPDRSALLRLDYPALAEQTIWARSDWGRDRGYYGRQYYYEEGAVACFNRVVHQGARVGLVLQDNQKFYHYMLQRPDVEFELLSPAVVSEAGEIPAATVRGFDYLLVGLPGYTRVAGNEQARVVWRFTEREGQCDRCALLIALQPQPSMPNCQHTDVLTSTLPLPLHSSLFGPTGGNMEI